MSELKNIKAHYLRFKVEEDLEMTEEENEQFTEGFKELCAQILDEDDDKYLVVENENYNGGGYEFMFLFFEENKTKILLDYLLDNNAVDFHKDVTQDIISGEIYEDADFKKVYYGFEESRKLHKENNITYVPQFRSTFDNFILKNVTTDDILDKINDKGIDALTDLDKDILNGK